MQRVCGERITRRGLVWRHGLTVVMAVPLLFLLQWTLPRPAGAEDAKAADAGAPEETGGESASFHEIHVTTLNIECTGCHAAEEGRAGGGKARLSKRPYHSACGDCHDEIEAAEEHGPLCQVCHTAPVEVSAFPTGKLTLTDFSHTRHVDPQGRLNKETGMRQDCTFCHVPSTSERAPSTPDHPQCASCHGGEGAVTPAIDLAGGSDACLGCHSLDRIDQNLAPRRSGQAPLADAENGARWQTGRGRIYQDIVPFPHNLHSHRRDGAAIDCITCHTAILDRSAVAAISPVPPMTECAKCHDNANFVSGHALSKQCGVCHTKIGADTLPAPGEPVSREIVHNASFRRFHNVAADRDDAVCASCHREVVNVGTDKCAGCHSAMQPKSHLALRWNELWHGRQVAFDRAQCTTCHTADFCSKCHDQVLPRSHVPLASFIAGGHRQAASLNIRSCFTCHEFETTCEECHSEQLP